MISLSNNSLLILHKLTTHLLSAATQIDEFGLNLNDYAQVSAKLRERQGVNLGKLRACCDELMEIEKEEIACAQSFQDYLDSTDVPGSL